MDLFLRFFQRFSSIAILFTYQIGDIIRFYLYTQIYTHQHQQVTFTIS